MALAVLLCPAGLWAYRGSFQGVFLFDDVKPILENRGIDRFRPPTTVGQRRLVAHLSLALNYKRGGTRVGGYHAFNLGVHLAAGLMLYGLARRTLELPALAGRYRRNSLLLAFAIALDALRVQWWCHYRVFSKNR